MDAAITVATINVTTAISNNEKHRPQHHRHRHNYPHHIVIISG